MPDHLLTWRSEFPILEQTVYMISNSLGAMPRGAAEALQEYADCWATRGVRAWEEGWWEMAVELGSELAPILGVKKGTISMHPNVTLAQAIVLSCFHFVGEKKKLVTTEMNFPSLLYLYQQSLPEQASLEIVQSEDGVTVPTERMLDVIDEETLIVSFSHVLYKTAYIQDVESITKRAHEVGALVLLDVYQSAGTIPLQLKAWGVDFAVGGTLKWLCGGPGGAFLYVRPDLLPVLKPRITGWLAHTDPFDFDPGPIRYREDAFRFLNGTPHIPCLYAAKSGIEIINTIGTAAIRKKSIHQTTLLIELAKEYDFPVRTPDRPNERGGTVAIDVPHAKAVCEELLRRNFQVDYRPGVGIRLSPHFYTDDDELALILHEIKKILESRAYGRHISE